MEERHGIQLSEFSFLNKPPPNVTVSIVVGNVAKSVKMQTIEVDALYLVDELQDSTLNRTVYKVKAEQLLYAKIWNVASTVVHGLLEKVCTRSASYEKYHPDYVDFDIVDWEDHLSLIQRCGERFQLNEDNTICLVQHNGKYVDMNAFTGQLNLLLEAGIDFQLMLTVKVAKNDAKIVESDKAVANNDLHAKIVELEKAVAKNDVCMKSVESEKDRGRSPTRSSSRSRHASRRRREYSSDSSDDSISRGRSKERRKRRRKKKSKRRSKNKRKKRSSSSDSSSSDSSSSSSSLYQLRKMRDALKKQKKTSLPLEVEIMNSGEASKLTGDLSKSSRNSDSLRENTSIQKEMELEKRESDLKERENASFQKEMELKKRELDLRERENASTQKKMELDLQKREISLQQMEKENTFKKRELDLQKREISLQQKEHSIRANQHDNASQQQLALNTEVRTLQAPVTRLQNQVIIGSSLRQIVLTQEEKAKLSPELNALVVMANALHKPTPNLKIILDDIVVDKSKFATLDEKLVDMKKNVGVDLLKTRPTEFYLHGNHDSLEGQLKGSWGNVCFKVGIHLMVRPYAIEKKAFFKSWNVDEIRPLAEKLIYILSELGVKFLKLYSRQKDLKKKVQNKMKATLKKANGKEEELISQVSPFSDESLKAFMNFLTDCVKRKFNYDYVIEETSDELGQLVRRVPVEEAKESVLAFVQRKVDAALGRSFQCSSTNSTWRRRGDYEEIHEEVNEWVKNRNADNAFSLHRACSSFNPLEQVIFEIVSRQGLKAFKKQDSVGVTPSQYLSQNPFTDIKEEKIIKRYVLDMMGEIV